MFPWNYPAKVFCPTKFHKQNDFKSGPRMYCLKYDDPLGNMEMLKLTSIFWNFGKTCFQTPIENDDLLMLWEPLFIHHHEETSLHGLNPSRPWCNFNLGSRPSSTQRAAGDVLPDLGQDFLLSQSHLFLAWRWFESKICQVYYILYLYII